jgi:Flp pilus assembly pilin Flp
MQDTCGGTSAEYVVILGLVIVASMGALRELGGILGGVVTNVQIQLDTPP